MAIVVEVVELFVLLVKVLLVELVDWISVHRGGQRSDPMQFFCGGCCTGEGVRKVSIILGRAETVETVDAIDELPAKLQGWWMFLPCDVMLLMVVSLSVRRYW